MLGATKRYPVFNNLTLPLKAFLITSAGTFSGIISADHFSRAYEFQRNPLDRQYREREEERAEAEVVGKSFTERAMDFGRKERYKIVGASWVASMFAAFTLVSRNKYLTGSQKLVQARVYAQFLTLGVLVASAAFEISDSKNDEGKLWETVMTVDPNDPEHKKMIAKREHKEQWEGEDMWKDMLEAEEERLKHRDRGQKKKHQDQQTKKPKSGVGEKSKGEPKKKEKADDSEGDETDGESEGDEDVEDNEKGDSKEQKDVKKDEKKGGGKEKKGNKKDEK